MRFGKFCYVLSGLSSLAFADSKTHVFTYNNNANKVVEIERFTDFQNILYDKLEVDDLIFVNESLFENLEHIDASEYLYGQSDSKKGHLLIALEEEGTADEIKEKFSKNSIKPLFEIKENGFLNENQVLSLLITKQPELSVKVNSEGFKFISNDDESHRTSYLNTLLKLDKKGPINENEKSLINLEYAINSIFPRSSVYSYSSSDSDVKYATLTIQIDRSGESFTVGSIENNLIELVKQASYHGIESTIILTANKEANALTKEDKSKYYLGSKRSLSQRLAKEGTYTSEEECILSTNNCNTHGLCSKNALSGSWGCICSSTFNKTSKSTTQWSGSSCNKIDVSTEFNLLFWSSLVMIITVVASIALIFKMDSEPLPGLLAASTSPSFKN